jgi:hypothetical protein
MKILQKASLTLIAGFGALLAATTAHAQSLRAFEATAHQLTIVPGGFAGTGTVNIMGAVTVTINVVQDFSGYPCNPATAEVTYVGATGSITTSDAAGWVCPSATRYGYPFTIQGVWSVTGGTGQFSGIIGSGGYEGTLTNGGNFHSSGIVVY